MFKIEWSAKAKLNLESEMEFWNDHNKSTVYSKKIRTEILKVHLLLKQNPRLGQETNFQNVRRILISTNFSIFYKISQNAKIIFVLSFRSNHQDLEPKL